MDHSTFRSSISGTVSINVSIRVSRIHESYQQEKLEQALETMGLSLDILKLESKEVLTTIKDRFRTLAMIRVKESSDNQSTL